MRPSANIRVILAVFVIFSDDVVSAVVVPVSMSRNTEFQEEERSPQLRIIDAVIRCMNIEILFHDIGYELVKFAARVFDIFPV